MRTWNTTVAAILTVLAAGADTGPIVVNSSLDEIADGRAAGWQSNSRCFRAEKGAGVNGSGGAVWESAEPTAQCGFSQRLALKVGQAYRFDALVRCEGFSGKACMCVEWSDRNGKWISGAYAQSISQQNTDWTAISGSTRDMPTNAASFVVMLYIPKGATGKVSFDNVNVCPLARDPVAYVISSRYRDCAAKGDVTFHAALFPPEDAKDPKAVFSWTDARGRRQRRAADSRSDDAAALTLAVADLAPGRSDVTCELADGGRTLGAASCTFDRVERLPQRRVWIDRHGRCIVDGKPFFPLGMYCGRMDADKLAVYRKGPFNCVMPYSTGTVGEMNAAWDAGIMMFVNLKGCTPGSSWSRAMKMTTQEQIDAFLRGKIAEYGNCPGLLGWYLNDESPLTEVPLRRHMYRLFRDNDAQHPVWIVLARAYDMREFAPTADVMGIDPYPIPERPMRYVTDFQREARRRIFDAHALWNVPQCFDWSWFRSDLSGPGRFPSADEMRSMCWQHIAGGANGLVGYCFYKFWDSQDPKAEKRSRCFRREHWETICEVHEEVRRMIPVMLSVDACPDVAPVSGDFPCRAWSKDGDLFVLVCNIENESRTVRLAIGEGAWKVAATEVGASATMEDARTVRADLPALGVSFVRLSGK